MYFPVFVLFVTIQYSGYICKAGPNTSQIYDLHQKISNNAGIYSMQNADCSNTIVPPGFVDIMMNCERGLIFGDRNSKLMVVVIENRFVAAGIITDIKRASKGVQKFSLQIKKTESCKDYPNFGVDYEGKTVEIFSEIGIPSSFQVGMEVSVILRISGDEWGQTLFLVEVIESGTKNSW